MSEQATEERPAQAEESVSQRVKRIRKQRRERGQSGEMAGMNLSVPEDRKDPRFVYRWTDEANLAMRQREATFGGDYEVVDNHDGSFTDGRNMEESGTVARLAERQTGSRLVLTRKPKELYDDDQQEKVARTKEQENAMIKRGVAHDSQGLTSDQQHYTPSEVSAAGRKGRR